MTYFLKSSPSKSLLRHKGGRKTRETKKTEKEERERGKKKNTSSPRQTWPKGCYSSVAQRPRLANEQRQLKSSVWIKVQCSLAQHSQGIEMLYEPQQSYNQRCLFLSLSLSRSLPPLQPSCSHSPDWLHALQMGGCWPRWLLWCWGGLWESREQMEGAQFPRGLSDVAGGGEGGAVTNDPHAKQEKYGSSTDWEPEHCW